MPITEFDKYFSDAAIECDVVGPADSGATNVAEASSPVTVTATFTTDALGNQPSINRIKWILVLYTPASSISVGIVYLTASDGTNTLNIAAFPAMGAPTGEMQYQGEATITGLPLITNFVSVSAVIASTVGGTIQARLRVLGNQ
jgi:hypothetical protein